MIESWVIDEAGSPSLSSEAVSSALRARVDGGQLETWLCSSRGRWLAFVTNGERAMVMLLDREGDPGEHAVDPGADGESDGFVLANGQDDEYPDQDTVPLAEGLRIVECIVGTGAWPADARWVVDR
ncbi:hypothetical protein FKN01_06840 [Streptomyces sp. 130]|uniref:hypothetical protein n=1 Tax=Streptomyces sp. 130 TaxID=2591006 RepID=UPI00117F6CA0|nr:hypothetical protein [Streptomyces sp. 130]TRV80456.1 hypothetical protein FKN01_06840 [Streptomyces sp. 130]